MNNEIELLKGKTLSDIKIGENEILFTCEGGQQIKMYHSQDCCEEVRLEDVNGDIQDLIGEPLIVAEENSNQGEGPNPDDDDSWTWTFYRFATIKGCVVLRWYGSSNGYYSEDVDIVAVRNNRKNRRTECA